MRTLVLDPATPGLDEILERRRQSGMDRFDEVWEGVLHLAPAPRGEHADISQQLAEILGASAREAGLVATIAEFNLGESEHDFRIPDGGIHRERPSGVWIATAAIVVEMISPAGDESWEKLPFYARQLVDEVLIVDPPEHAVHWLALTAGTYEPIDHSRLIDMSAADLAERIDWPPAA